MLKPEKKTKASPLRGALTAVGAIAIIAGATLFLLYRFGILGGDGSTPNAPAPADQLLNQMPEAERKQVREKMRAEEAVETPKPPAGS